MFERSHRGPFRFIAGFRASACWETTKVHRQRYRPSPTQSGFQLPSNSRRRPFNFSSSPPSPPPLLHLPPPSHPLSHLYSPSSGTHSLMLRYPSTYKISNFRIAFLLISTRMCVILYNFASILVQIDWFESLLLASVVSCSSFWGKISIRW